MNPTLTLDRKDMNMQKRCLFLNTTLGITLSMFMSDVCMNMILGMNLIRQFYTCFMNGSRI